MEGLVYGKEIMDSSRWADISINVQNRALNGLLEDHRLMPWIRCWMINVWLHLFHPIDTFKLSSNFFPLIMIKVNYTKYLNNMSKEWFIGRMLDRMNTRSRLTKLLRQVREQWFDLSFGYTPCMLKPTIYTPDRTRNSLNNIES